MFGLRISKLSNLPRIEIWNKFQIPTFTDGLEEFPNQVKFVYITRPIRVPSLNKVSPKFNPWFPKYMPHKEMRTWQRTPKIINAQHSAPKKNAQHFSKCCIPKKIFHLSFLMFPSICVCSCVPTKAHLYMHIFLYIKCIFCALTCLLSMWCIPKHTMTHGIKWNESKSAQGKR